MPARLIRKLADDDPARLGQLINHLRAIGLDAIAARVEAVLRDLVCANCGTRFLATRSDAKTCSVRCKSAHRRATRASVAKAKHSRSVNAPADPPPRTIL
jgi:hypothetical protein